VFTLLGTYLYSVGTVRDLRISFILMTIGNILWLSWAYNNGVYSMIVTSIVFGFFNTKAYYTWKKYDYTTAL